MTANTLSYGNASVGFISAPLAITATIAKAVLVNDTGSAVATTASTLSSGISLWAGTSGDTIDVQLAGIALWTAGAAVGIYATVDADGSGYCITHTSGGVAQGKALAAAGASGDIIPVLLAPQGIVG
jgi:hypothetical protein